MRSQASQPSPDESDADRVRYQGRFPAPQGSLPHRGTVNRQDGRAFSCALGCLEQRCGDRPGRVGAALRLKGEGRSLDPFTAPLVSRAPSASRRSSVITPPLVGEPRDVPRLRHFLILQDASSLKTEVSKSCTPLLVARSAGLPRLNLNPAAPREAAIIVAVPTRQHDSSDTFYSKMKRWGE